MVYFVEAKQPTTVTGSLLSLIFAQNLYKSSTQKGRIRATQNNKPSVKNMRCIFHLLLERAGHVTAYSYLNSSHLVITPLMSCAWWLLGFGKFSDCWSKNSKLLWFTMFPWVTPLMGDMLDIVSGGCWVYCRATCKIIAITSNYCQAWDHSPNLVLSPLKS